jgi:hypothetical protein
VCGKHLLDNKSDFIPSFIFFPLTPFHRRAYCSDECQGVDVASPSISSASSAFSSPRIEYAAGGEVPPLVPSALGLALSHCQAGDRYSSSSASSTSWSVVTDDEDDNAALGSDNGYYSDANSYEGSSRSLSLLRPSGLNYARRPSGTNNRSTIPLLHRRASSGSNVSSSKNLPRNSPSIHSLEDDDEAASRFSSHHSQNLIQSPSSWTNNDRKATITKTKRTRNRASLPAYFSLLQTGSSSPRSSPLSASSGITLTHHSPPTPKLGLSGRRFPIPSGTPSTVEATPRGRRREPRMSQSRHCSRQSHSHSRSRSRSRPLAQVPPHLSNHLRGRLDSKSSVEQVFDWTSSVIRGRPPMRRNSSPPPRMILEGLDDYISRDSEGRRGRIRTDELDGDGPSARGYGNGRSGLKDREREGVSRNRALTALH